MPEIHFEPYLVLAGLTHEAALVTWGGFYFRVRAKPDGERWKVVDDGDLKRLHPPRYECVGARSTPYGHTVVQVFDTAGAPVVSAESSTCNHAWITGLTPDTEYRYRVTVNGEEWAAGPRRDWVEDGSVAGDLAETISAVPKAPHRRRVGLYRDEESPRSYDNRFRTFPAPDRVAPLTFAVLGDFGVGIRPGKADACQLEVSRALERAALENDVRFVVTTGDNIYAKRVLGVPITDYGDEDDDWFFTFHQPYRYLLNRMPFYPSVGNHDSADIEENDDREQVIDNLYLRERFAREETKGRASIGPGLFYRFRFGALAEFVALDTSRATVLPGTPRLFLHPNHAAFLEASFPAVSGGSEGVLWRLPFGHHPPYCAGPRHRNTESMLEHLVPRFQRSGVRAFFAGHEHNYQHSLADGIHYFLTGAGGKVRTGVPRSTAEARTVSWAAAGHFLLVKLDAERMEVTPIGADGLPLGVTVIQEGGDVPVVVRL